MSQARTLLHSKRVVAAAVKLHLDSELVSREGERERNIPQDCDVQLGAGEIEHRREVAASHCQPLSGAADTVDDQGVQHAVQRCCSMLCAHELTHA